MAEKLLFWGIVSRQFNFTIGRDFYRGPNAYSIGLGLFKRFPDFRPWEINFRLYGYITAYRPSKVFGGPRGTLFGWKFYAELHLIPAWRDVPSVVREYERTML